MYQCSSYIMAGYHCQWRASDCCNLQRGSRNKLISHLFYNFIINLRWWPRPTPSEKAPGGGVYSYTEIMPLDGKTAHHGGNFLCEFCFTSKKSSEREFFVPAGTHLGVKLLNITPAVRLTSIDHHEIEGKFTATPSGQTNLFYGFKN